jgi:hypothetical protein
VLRAAPTPDSIRLFSAQSWAVRLTPGFPGGSEAGRPMPSASWPRLANVAPAIGIRYNQPTSTPRSVLVLCGW